MRRENMGLPPAADILADAGPEPQTPIRLLAVGGSIARQAGPASPVVAASEPALFLVEPTFRRIACYAYGENRDWTLVAVRSYTYDHQFGGAYPVENIERGCPGWSQAFEDFKRRIVTPSAGDPPDPSSRAPGK